MITGESKICSFLSYQIDHEVFSTKFDSHQQIGNYAIYFKILSEKQFKFIILVKYILLIWIIYEEYLSVQQDSYGNLNIIK